MGETDIDCDNLPLSAADLDALTQIVLASQTACYATSPAAPERNHPARTIAASATDAGYPLRSIADPVFRVELQSTTYSVGDSACAEIVLAEAGAGLLGFQFHLEFDASVLALENIYRGYAISNWQFFDYHLEQTETMVDLRVAAVAQYNGPALLPDDIDLLPAPQTLVRLKFGFVEPVADEPINFVWASCGDNALVSGRLNGETLLVDSLLLTHAIFGPDNTDLTGVNARYGGSDYTCFYDLFGNTPAAAVDFKNGTVTIDPGCCVGLVGNVNGQGADEPTLADISTLIDHLFISRAALGCLEEADVNQSGVASPTYESITLADVAMLIDHLFITRVALPPCL